MNIPDYTLLQSCGKGAYGQVWLAQSQNNKLVALKYIASSQALDREYDGILNYSQLPESPYLVRILHLGKLEDGFFYTMELADGLYQNGQYIPETLAERIKNKKFLLPGEVIELADSILKALATLHKAGMIHRDIKPENILYFNGVPKLSDMGLVRHTEDTVSLCGTIGFIPPERLAPGNAALPYEESDDLYALGKVLYCAMTGNAVEKFPSYHEDMIHNTLCSHLNQIILKACGKRDERFSSVEEFTAALRNGIPVDKNISKKRRNVLGKLLFIFLAVIIFCVISLFGLFLLKKAQIISFSEDKSMNNAEIASLIDRKITAWENSNKKAAVPQNREPEKVVENQQELQPDEKTEKKQLYTLMRDCTQEEEAHMEKLHLRFMAMLHPGANRIETPEKKRAIERLFMLLDFREKKEGKLRHFNSGKELEIYKLTMQATEKKGGFGGDIGEFNHISKPRRLKPTLIYENNDGTDYPGLNLGRSPRRKINYYSFRNPDSGKEKEKTGMERLDKNNNKMFVYANSSSKSVKKTAKEKILYSSNLPEEFALRCKILTTFDAIKTFAFEFYPEMKKGEKISVDIGVLQTLSWGSTLQVEVKKGIKKYTTNFMNYLLALADFCYNNSVTKSPNEFFYLEIINTGDNFAVYVNDVLMVNLPGKHVLKSGRIIQHANAENSIEKLEIFSIPPDENCPESKRYFPPDTPSEKKW